MSSMDGMARDRELVRSVWAEWDLLEPLGSGQFGTVYKAHRHGFAGDSYAAVKIVTIEQENNESGFSPEQTDAYLASVAQNYAREIRMMECVKGYSNIVSIEDYHVCRNSGGKPWHVLIRMELLTPLHEYLEGQEITDEKIVRLGTDLCRALETCRAKQIVHRDIKPANVFANDDGVFKLGDFGVARQILAYTSQTRTGSPDFMAPEVYHGTLKASDFEQAHRADIYSLGMLLYWAANGRRMPFLRQGGLITANEITDAFTRKMSGEALPAPAHVSGPLQQVILKACDYRPEGRYETAEAFRAALEGVLTGIGETGAKKKIRPALIAALCCVALLAGFLAYSGANGWQTWPFASPTATPTEAPTATPTEEPTATPTEEPTATPTEEPTATPTEAPTATPTEEPTATPTEAPTATPTEEPTATPTEEPTATPTEQPTATPTEEPTATPTEEPTATPTEEPTATPTEEPTATPTEAPTEEPTEAPAQPAWEERTLEPVDTKLKTNGGDDRRYQAYYGPGANAYGTAGAYKPAHMQSMAALFREGDYVLVDMNYPNVGRRCVYFKASSLQDADITEAALTAVPAVVTKNCQPRLGPGNKYDKDSIPELKAGAKVSVFFEAEGWLFTEFSSTPGRIRAWLPADSVTGEGP